MELADGLLSNVQKLNTSIVAQAISATDYTPIFTSFCDRLVEAGLPVFRIHIATSTLHPLAEGVSGTWRRNDGVVQRMHEHGSTAQDDWLSSPIKAMLDANNTSIRFQENDLAEARKNFPLIDELMLEGLTDYYGMAMVFSDSETTILQRDGLIASFATDTPGGFTPAHVEAINLMMPTFALVAKLANRELVFTNVLDAYLGPDAGKHVKDGQIALGTGDIIDAVIWFCDLRGSVTLAETLGHQGFIDLLNEYFAALAGSVLESGGQVLRFIGDAALAIFPISDDGMTMDEAKSCAIQAARLAVDQAAKSNADRKERGLTPFDFGIGLHVGQIMYGNIGVPSRVEFSVIGPAANEAARIESLCKSIGEVVLVSEAFRDGLDGEWRDLGPHPIRGSTEIRLFAPEV